jgi:hypothetical protein
MKFFDYLLDTLRLLGGLRTGLATAAGTTTSLADTVRRNEIADYWNGGTIWIITDAGGAGAAPEHEFSPISDFGSGVFTFAALTAAVASGDRYAVSPAHYPCDVLIDCVNLAMKQYRVPKSDITSLDVVAGQTEYALPAAVRMGWLKEVYIETVVDANDHRWQQVGEWWSVDDGANETLILPSDLLEDYAGRNLRLDYEEVHTDLTSAGAEVESWLEPRYVVFRAAETMLLQLMYQGDQWPYLEQRMNYFIARADLYEKEFFEKVKQNRRI